MKYQCSKCGETENLHYNYDYSQQHRPVIDVFCNVCENTFDGNMPVAKLTPHEGITRLEVINHAENNLQFGRALTLYKSMGDFQNVELSYQDNGKTLKIFLS